MVGGVPAGQAVYSPLAPAEQVELLSVPEGSEQLGSRPDRETEGVCFGFGRMVLHKSEMWKYTSSLKVLRNALKTIDPGEVN